MMSINECINYLTRYLYIKPIIDILHKNFIIYSVENFKSSIFREFFLETWDRNLILLDHFLYSLFHYLNITLALKPKFTYYEDLSDGF